MLEAYYCDFSAVSDSECDLLRAAEDMYFTNKDGLKRKDSLCARAILCKILQEKFCIKDFTVDCEKDGKPFVSGGEICFNLSHSDNYALCAVSDSQVGCDIERIRQYKNKVAERFFTRKEFCLLEGSKRQDILFTRLWTMKESILKCLGAGLSGGLSEYDFSSYAHLNYFTAHNLCFNVFEFPEYVICICSKENEKLTPPVEIEISVHE